MADCKTETHNCDRYDQLLMFDQELQQLYQRCIEKGKSVYEIKSAGSTVFCISKPEKQSRRELLSKTGIKLSLVVLLVACLIAVVQKQPTVNKAVVATWRQSLIVVLAVVDWRGLHDVPCLIPNPMDTGMEHTLKPNDCEVCDNITEVAVLESIGMDELTQRYLERDAPIIILTADEPQRRVTLHDLVQLFLEDDAMSLYTSCDFETNMNVSVIRNQRALLSAFQKGAATSFYAHWSNCFTEASKRFRVMYRKPDFLPLSLEITTENWVFVCSSFQHQKLIKLPMLDQVMILIQLAGDLDLVLTPKSPCSNNCTRLNTTLTEGSTFLVSDFFYDIAYVTCDKGTSITAGLLAKWDM